jgi:hypothetical protein
MSPPIFILSCERSGSTLLRYILDSHPEIACPGELCLGQLVQALRLTISRTVAQTDAATDEKRAEWTRAEVRRIVDEILTAYKSARGKRIWCDKTPMNVQGVADLAWAFPEARYLCLYRRSVDVAYSCLEASQYGFMTELAPYVQRDPHNLIAAMLASWADKTARILRFEAGNPSCCRLHYEALVNAPEATLDFIFRFLKLDWDTSLIEHVFTTAHDPGGGDHKIRQTRRIEADRIGKGSRLPSSILARLPGELQERLAELHFELGYPL